MSGPALLHNMSVPPVSTFTVASPGLAGRLYCIDWPSHSKGFDRNKLPSPEKLEAAFARLRLPSLVGVFTETDGDRKIEATIPYPAALALLARRSGHLYLPWRPVYPPLVPTYPCFLVFPDDGSPA